MNHPRPWSRPTPFPPKNIQQQLLHWTWGYMSRYMGIFHCRLQTQWFQINQLISFTINVNPWFYFTPLPSDWTNPKQPQLNLVPDHPSAVPDPATPPRSWQAVPAPSQASAAARPAAQPLWSGPAPWGDPDPHGNGRAPRHKWGSWSSGRGWTPHQASCGLRRAENEDLMPIKVFSGVHVWLTILGT